MQALRRGLSYGSDRARRKLNFGACYTRNYREFMSGFEDFVETIADSRNAHDYRPRVSLPETVSMWKSLSYGANYRPTREPCDCAPICGRARFIVSGNPRWRLGRPCLPD